MGPSNLSWRGAAEARHTRSRTRRRRRSRRRPPGSSRRKSCPWSDAGRSTTRPCTRSPRWPPATWLRRRRCGKRPRASCRRTGAAGRTRRRRRERAARPAPRGRAAAPDTPPVMARHDTVRSRCQYKAQARPPPFTSLLARGRPRRSCTAYTLRNRSAANGASEPFPSVDPAAPAAQNGPAPLIRQTNTAPD